MQLVNLKSLSGTTEEEPSMRPSTLTPPRGSPLSGPSITPSTLENPGRPLSSSMTLEDGPIASSSFKEPVTQNFKALPRKQTARKSTKTRTSTYTQQPTAASGSGREKSDSTRIVQDDLSLDLADTLSMSSSSRRALFSERPSAPSSPNSSPPPLILTESEREALIQHAQRFFRNSVENKSSRGKGPKATFKAGKSLAVPLVSRTKFEAIITKNTTEEDHAPKIHIINEVDDEPCPTLDFHWTNAMLYGTHVPRPTLAFKRRRSSLSRSRSISAGADDPSGKGKGKAVEDDNQEADGCDCSGAECDPFNGCSCATKQAIEVARAPGRVVDRPEGFMYHGANSEGPEGTLKQIDIRIVECTPQCGCSSRCTNRVRTPHYVIETPLIPPALFVFLSSLSSWDVTSKSASKRPLREVGVSAFFPPS